MKNKTLLRMMYIIGGVTLSIQEYVAQENDQIQKGIEASVAFMKNKENEAIKSAIEMLSLGVEPGQVIDDLGLKPEIVDQLMQLMRVHKPKGGITEAYQEGILSKLIRAQQGSRAPAAAAASGSKTIPLSKEKVLELGQMAIDMHKQGRSIEDILRVKDMSLIKEGIIKMLNDFDAKKSQRAAISTEPVRGGGGGGRSSDGPATRPVPAAADAQNRLHFNANDFAFKNTKSMISGGMSLAQILQDRDSGLAEADILALWTSMKGENPASVTGSAQSAAAASGGGGGRAPLAPHERANAKFNVESLLRMEFSVDKIMEDENNEGLTRPEVQEIYDKIQAELSSVNAAAEGAARPRGAQMVLSNPAHDSADENVYTTDVVEKVHIYPVPATGNCGLFALSVANERVTRLHALKMIKNGIGSNSKANRQAYLRSQNIDIRREGVLALLIKDLLTIGESIGNAELALLGHLYGVNVHVFEMSVNTTDYPAATDLVAQRDARISLQPIPGAPSLLVANVQYDTRNMKLIKEQNLLGGHFVVLMDANIQNQEQLIMRQRAKAVEWQAIDCLDNPNPYMLLDDAGQRVFDRLATDLQRID
ncbi:MAG: hypothetical protein Q8K36_02735 [Alphaproteobacteria bacterium]|nr:hypothetical protein [Alphaproteobacteria bacterium]